MAPRKEKPKEITPEEAEKARKTAEVAAAVISSPVLGETPEQAIARMAQESKRLLFENGLSKPFHPNELKWKPQAVKGNRALAICYLDARAVMDRLDEVVGVEGWRDEYEVLANGCVICRLTVMTPFCMFLTKCDVGNPSEQPDQGDRIKAAFSDALKRAAVKFGIGRYIYRIPHQWVDYDPVKKQIVRTPQLPAFALPKKNSPAPTPYTEPPEERELEKKQEESGNSKGDSASLAAAASAKSEKVFIEGRIEWWKDHLNGCETEAQTTQLITEELKDEPMKSKAIVWDMIQQWVKSKGWKWDANSKQVIGPAPVRF